MEHDQPLPELLPITLENGFRLVHIADECRFIDCQKLIGLEHWRGFASLPLQSVTLNLKADCPHCSRPQERLMRLTAVADRKARLDVFGWPDFDVWNEHEPFLESS